VVVAVLEAEFRKCVMLLKMPKSVLTLHSQGQHIEQLLLHVQPARQPRTPSPARAPPPALVRARRDAASHESHMDGFSQVVVRSCSCNNRAGHPQR
jgi:hypothetical protein